MPVTSDASAQQKTPTSFSADPRVLQEFDPFNRNVEVVEVVEEDAPETTLNLSIKSIIAVSNPEESSVRIKTPDGSEDRYEEFFTYYRKRSETIQEYTSEFNRRYTRAHEEKIDLGDRVKGYWYLRQGRFSEEQKRWILTPIRNDWSKFTEMQQSALEMPAVISGSAHYADKDDSGIFWANYWAERPERAAAWDTHWANGPSDSSGFNNTPSGQHCANCVEWETCYNEVYQALDEWGLTDPAAWEEDDYEDCNEAYWNDDDWETCYEGDEDDYQGYYGEYDDDDEEPNLLEIYTADASDCHTSEDERECEVYLQQRKAYRSLRKKHGKGFRRSRKYGRSKGRGKGGKSGWRPRKFRRSYGKGGGYRRRPKGRGKGRGRKHKYGFPAHLMPEDENEESYAEDEAEAYAVRRRKGGRKGKGKGKFALPPSFEGKGFGKGKTPFGFHKGKGKGKFGN